MGRTLYIIIALAGMAYLFSACSEVEDTVLPENEYGSLFLDLETVQPNRLVMTKAAAIDVNTFSVVIKQEDKTVKSFETFQKLKESGTLRLEKGIYTIVASQQGEMAEVSGQPFYSGQGDVEVEANAFAKPTITCKMQQVRVKVELDKVLIDALTSVPDDLSISNGNTKGLHKFEIDEETGESDEIYIRPTENLRLSFSATEKEYQEPVIYNELLKYKDGKSPVANDYLTVTIGLATGGTKTFASPSANRPLNLKVTVR